MPRVKPPAPILGELAISDTRRGVASGFALERYNPDELARKGGGLAIYDKMRVDEQVKAVLLLKKAAIVGPGWQIAAGDDSQGAQDLADEITVQLLAFQGRTFTSILFEVLSALDYGFSVSELIWQPAPFALVDIKARAPHDITFDQDEFGAVGAIVQQQLDMRTRPQGGLFGGFVRGGTRMSPDKFLHYVNQPEFDNPFGISDLRAAYVPWWHKSNWRQWLAIWGEKLADSPVLAKHPAGLAPEKVSALITSLEKLQAKSVVAVPIDPLGKAQYDVELLESTRNVRDVFLNVIDGYNLAIAKALLMPDKLGTAGGEVQQGSLALAQEQGDTFQLYLEFVRAELTAMIQRRIVDTVTMFLAGDVDEKPQFQLLPLSQENRQAIVTLFNAAVEKGTVLADVRDENRIRELLEFPEVEETEDQMRQAMLDRKREQAQVTADLRAQGNGGGNGLDRAGAGGMDGAGSDRGEPHAGNGTAATMAEESDSFWRPLTAAETRADIPGQRRLLETGAVELGLVLSRNAEALIADVEKRAARILAHPSPEAIAQLDVDPAVRARAFAETYARLLEGYARGHEKAVTET